MGGIGKTTLARSSYEAPRTLHHFDLRFWVTVSQEYNIQEILKGLLPEAERTKYHDEQLIEYVHKHLKGRRYLIVLDDMWEVKAWDRLRNAFPDDNKCSRVILTTRSSRVASCVGSSIAHEMQFLSEDHSWDLLRENVYGQECCSTEFEGIGQMIARNCKGLPLAVVVVAGLLKFNRTREYWEQVAQSTGEKVTTSNNHLFEILSWSYTRLPPHLKACFLHVGTYREDYEIPTKELVRLWAAEGFLKPKQYRSMEEVAEECLEELAERSLVLVTKRSYNGKIRICRVHDVIREVSIRKAEEEKFHYHFTSSVDESSFRKILDVQRRVSITNCSIDSFPLDTFCVTTHSLDDSYENMSIVKHFKLLRVLNKARVKRDSSISSQLNTLTNLRYLQLVSEAGDIQFYMPKSISKLQNLETLIVRAVYRDDHFIFPLEIWKLKRLRHFVNNGSNHLQVPVPSQCCPSLQTLSGVCNSNITKSFAEVFPNLKKLKLRYTKDDDDDEEEHPIWKALSMQWITKKDDKKEYTMENLRYLYQLEELSISCFTSYTNDFFRPVNFAFHHNLQKLTLRATRVPFGNLSSIGRLPNLKVLKLKLGSVKGEEWEPIEGGFLQLEHLKMEDLFITRWRAENVHFPSLRKLVVINCDWLSEVSESIGEIDTLETLVVKSGTEEARKWARKIKENQQNMCNDLLQVIILQVW